MVFCFLLSLQGGNPVVEHHVILLLYSLVSLWVSNKANKADRIIPGGIVQTFTLIFCLFHVCCSWLPWHCNTQSQEWESVCVWMRSQSFQDLLSQAMLLFLIAIWFMESFPSIIRSNDSRWGWAGKHSVLQAVLWHIKPETPHWHGLPTCVHIDASPSLVCGKLLLLIAQDHWPASHVNSFWILLSVTKSSGGTNLYPFNL